MLTPLARHLLAKNETFFRRAQMSNVQTWNARVEIALKWGEGKANFFGEDLVPFFFPTKQNESKKDRKKSKKKVRSNAHDIQVSEEMTLFQANRVSPSGRSLVTTSAALPKLILPLHDKTESGQALRLAY